jgi:copper chaperone CopZ
MSATASATLDVTGMHCGSCAALIQDTLVDQAGVETVEVDLESAKAEVGFDPTTISLTELCETIAGLGYGATPAAS